MNITVIVPSYNRADLIVDTLDAIFAQTTAPEQVIVVDDGSTDETQIVLGHYKKPVEIIRIKNSGDLVARNTGLKAAKGELVAFCDSDDLWKPDFLSCMATQFRETPDLFACYSDFRVLQGNTLSERSKFDDAPPGFWSGLRSISPKSGVFDTPIPERLISFQPFFPSCMMAARSAFLDVGGWDEGVSRLVGCDFATTLRVAAQPMLGVVSKPLVAIRKHASNFSANTEKMNLGDAQVLEYVLRTRPELVSLTNVIRQSITTRRREALDSAFSRRDFNAVRDIYRLLPKDGQSTKLLAKRAVAGLPNEAANLIAKLVSR